MGQNFFNMIIEYRMPQFLYKLTLRNDLFDDKNWTEEENQIVSDHFKRLQKGIEDGIVILAGRTLNSDKSGFGIVIFNAESDAQAETYMNQDPAVVKRVMTANLFPYRVALIKEENSIYK